MVKGLKEPKLRFSEYRGIEGWKEVKLGDIANIYQPQTIATSDCTDEGFDVFGANGFIGKYHRYNHELAQVTISCRGENSGVINFVPKKCWITGNSMVINTDDNSEVSKEFLHQCLRVYNLKKIVTGSGQPQITRDVLVKFKINIPNLKEQQKIGQFFTLLDKKISLQQSKIQSLNEYKKGLLQKVMNQEIRFKDSDGQEYSEWEEVKLGGVCSIITKGTTPSEFVKKSEIKFVKIESLNFNKIDNAKCLNIKEETHLNELRRSVLQENDILFSIAGSLGKCAIVEKENLPANTNQALSIIRLRDIDRVKYVLLILQSDKMLKYIYANMSIGAQPNLSLEQMNNFMFKLPCKEEQQKIASLFSTIDKKIEKEQQKLNCLQEQKRGYLRNMFI